MKMIHKGYMILKIKYILKIKLFKISRYYVSFLQCYLLS